MIFITLLIALMVDWVLGEPKRWHPLVGFGALASNIENRFNQSQQSPMQQFSLGLLAVLLCVLPFAVMTFFLSQIPFWGTIFSIMILTFSIGLRSLFDHARPILKAMQQNNLEHARTLASRIVSRDKTHLDVNRATIESVLENGNDAVFGVLFWFIIAGAPGAISYRLINTLDAMWGYRTPRFLYFGKAAARLDDVINFIPARLTALSYALLGKTRSALSCWRLQASLWDSPNAGPVMSSGAGALDIQLGGPACYHGEWHQRPYLGTHTPANATDIQHALGLVLKSVMLWLTVIGLYTGIVHA